MTVNNKTAIGQLGDGFSVVDGVITVEGGSGDVIGPATTTENNVPQWDATTKTLKNGLAIGTSASNLIQLDGDAKLPAVDGSLITGIAASNLSISSKSSVVTKKGQAVYIVTGNSALPDVALCDNTVLAKSRVFGIVVADGSIGDIISVRRGGILTNVDTQTTNTYVNPNAETWVEGDLLFATTNGGLTKIRPTSGRNVKVGYSLKGSSNTDSILLFPMENPVWVTCATAEDIVLRLGDNSGTNKVSIRDYANNEVASIDSDGAIVGSGAGITGIPLDINGLTAETSIADDDLISIYDTSASANRKMTKANFIAGLSGSSAFVKQWTIEGVVFETTFMHYVIPVVGTISIAIISLESAPSASSTYCEVQIMKNGLLETDSIFETDTPIQITEATSATNGVYQADGTLDEARVAVAAGDVIWCRVNHADAGSAGLLVQIKVNFT